MKKLTTALFALAFTASTVFAINAQAEDPATKNRNNPRLGKVDNKVSGMNVRASEMIGHDIHNSKGENIGEISDIVLDASTGKIKYIAVTYGGFLGVGDKMFAVPYEAFKSKPDPDDPDDHVIVLNVTQKHLEGAEGFDQDHWPNFGDEKFVQDLDKRYGVNRNQRMRDKDHNGVDINVERNDKLRDKDHKEADIDIDVNRKGQDGKVKPNVDNETR